MTHEMRQRMSVLRPIFVGVLVLLAVCAGAAYFGRNWVLNNVSPWIVEPVLGTVFGFRFERDVMIPARDGVRLATNIYYPTRRVAPFATLLIRLPYDKDHFSVARHSAISFARKGYAVAIQDIRGTFHSEGELPNFRRDGEDGSDTVDWLASQPWSNRRVGTFGCSSLGDTQILMARERNPRHSAMIASASSVIGSVGGRHGFGMFEGGILNLADNFRWIVENGGKVPGARLERPVDIRKALQGLPVLGMVGRFRSDPTDFDDLVSQPLDGPYFREQGFIDDSDRFATPALLIDTWHAPSVSDTLTLAETMKRNWVGGPSGARVYVIIAPGLHCDFWGAAESGRVGDLPVGKAAAQPYNEWFSAWFDYWLRGETSRKPDLAQYRFYVLGEDRWVDSDRWPPRDVAYKRWYLGGTRAANSSTGGGTLDREPPGSVDRYDEFHYDPADPVPTRGGPVLSDAGDPAHRQGPIDQREVEARKDVLVYTSAPLGAGVRIAGPLSAELFISSSARDTDFVVKLVDVRPDGTALNIQEGALRMRYRDGFADPKLMRAGEIYLARIDLRAIAYYLPVGHRLRLQVSSSNFPRLERNLNTGGRNFDESVGVVAVNRVYTTHNRASAVILPEWPDR